ncbi:MAG: hypothetical protein J5865_03830 [Lachnospiraceae bacterium]|nr:hypothetical protein [Lachnospiraceae bacterium]
MDRKIEKRLMSIDKWARMDDPAFERDRRQCTLALISCAVVAVCVTIGVVMNLTTLYDENFDHMGLRTFCMFTVNSNILTGLSMLLCLPYTIDGLRRHNYHLPNWIVDLMFAAVTAVALTFLVSLFILSPVKGFVLIFTGSRFFLHGVCPILAIIAFCFFISGHYIRFREFLWALIPVLIYAVVYIVMVVVIGEERGGWNDFYGFATRMPLWISITAIMPITLLIAALLRHLHNRTCLRRKEESAGLYKEILKTREMRQVIDRMAQVRRLDYRDTEIVIPSRTIRHLVENNDTDMTVEEGCRRYLRVYMEKEEE